MRFACAVLASLACLSVAVMGDGYGNNGYYPANNMYGNDYGYGKGGMTPYYGNYGGYSGYGQGGSGYGSYGKGGGGGGYYGGYPTIMYPVASPAPGDIPLGALAGGLGGGYGGGYGGGNQNIWLMLGGALLLLALLSNNTG